MIRLAEDFFATTEDPDQISITRTVTRRLHKIHPSTMTEKRTRKGPVAWILVIPTTRRIMEQFIAKKINERGLLDTTPLHAAYDSIYLCSALVLPEYRGKGLARSLMVKAVKSIRKDHPVHSLFYWEFSREGKKLAAAVARECSLPLSKRT